MTYVVKNDWVFDTKLLKAELFKLLEENEINNQRQGSLHGLCLTSQDGSLYNGFNFNVGIQDPPYDQQNKQDPNPKIYFNLEYAKQHKIYHMLDYNIETSACKSIWKQIIGFLYNKGMNPRRVRLSYLPPEGVINTHSDGGGYKFHIPIITDGTDFVHGNKSYTLQEGGSYLASVNPYHYVKNNGNTDRWHLVADVWDTVGNFSIGKVDQDEFDNEKLNAKLWRNYVNGKTEEPKKILLGAKN